ncbi:MAG TPA: SWIM zinc finger family protein, partial [Fimbriimonadaceae bacterium]|nr:SWIM zinc finger family protein [Fimbriimonadaceae bacterium]
ASAQAGKGLASISKWVSLGSDIGCVWGEAKGSAALPYQTCIDLSEPAFKCSCPSRKFPCKHGLGLFLLYAQGHCQTGSRPAWVTEWLDKRATRTETKVAKPRAEADPEAQSKRAAKREDHVASGIADCETWLRDLVRDGFANPAQASRRHFEAIASRLVDSQAPGLARLVRQMGETVSSGPAWQERLLERAATLYLLLQAFKRQDLLSDPVRADMRQAIGWTIRREELAAEPQVADVWTVLGQRTIVEDRVTTQRSWLYGVGTKRWATVLAFSVAGSPYDPALVPGTALAGSLAFFPGAAPLRALPMEVEATAPIPQPVATIDECLYAYATALSESPWIEAFPFALGNVRFGRTGDRWLAVQEGKALPLSSRLEPWKVLALTGGEPFDLVGEWNGRELEGLSAQIGGRLCRL